MTEQERPRTDWQDVYDLIDGTDYTVNDHAAREFIEKVRTEGRQQAVREIRDHNDYDKMPVRLRAHIDRVAGLNASESPPTDWPAFARDLMDQSPEATERLRQRAGLGDDMGQPPEATE